MQPPEEQETHLQPDLQDHSLREKYGLWCDLESLAFDTWGCVGSRPPLADRSRGGRRCSFDDNASPKGEHHRRPWYQQHRVLNETRQLLMLCLHTGHRSPSVCPPALRAPLPKASTTGGHSTSPVAVGGAAPSHHDPHGPAPPRLCGSLGGGIVRCGHPAAWPPGVSSLDPRARSSRVEWQPARCVERGPLCRGRGGCTGAGHPWALGPRFPRHRPAVQCVVVPGRHGSPLLRHPDPGLVRGGLPALCGVPWDRSVAPNGRSRRGNRITPDLRAWWRAKNAPEG